MTLRTAPLGTTGMNITRVGFGAWGRSVMVGEGGRLEIDVSPVLIHPQITVYGSWVTSTWRMAELAQNLVRWRPAS